MGIFRSIRAQVFLFLVAISLVTSLVMGVANYLEAEKVLDDTFDREINNTAYLLKQTIEGHLADARGAASVLAKNPSVQAMDSAAMKEISRYFLDFVSLFYNIYIYDREGTLRSVEYLDNIDRSETHSKNFHELRNEFTHVALDVLEDGKARYTEPFFRKDQLLIAYVTPIFKGSDKAVAGLASCGIFVHNPKLSRLMKSLVPPYQGFICLLDGEGRVFGREGAIPEAFTEFPLKSLKANLQGKSPLLWMEDKPYLYTIKEIEEAHLYVLVATSCLMKEKLFSTLLSELVAINVISFLVALLISAALGNFLVKPINALVEGIREVGKGNYSYSIHERAFGEIGEAVQSYNEMAEKLQKNRLIENLWNEKWKGDDTTP
ncbi:MAG: HAMP domain-containing protein [Candidatus Eremiobacteraeota bacterium]|nr:HAMP domain-containing protein [Candidatus Eremiobacteraeota bacterium]